MLNFLKMRARGRQLARQVRASLENPNAGWKLHAAMADDCLHISNGTFRIIVRPCWPCPCLRILECARLACDGCDVFVPPLASLRLRNAARVFAAEQALSKI